MGVRTAELHALVGRLAPIAGWMLVTPMLFLAATQVLGVSGGPAVAIAQALTPFLLLPALPLASVALWRRRWGLGVAGSVVVLVLIELCWPLAFPPGQPAAMPSAQPLRVLHSNLMYANETLDEAVATLLSTDADVLAITEYTPNGAAALAELPGAERYPHRIEHAAGGATGTAIWSRYPMRRHPAPATRFNTIIATVDDPNGGDVRVLAVHPPTPTGDYADWRAELRQLDELAHTSEPTMLIGDFNASWWHPEFRDLLDAGFRDAHQVAGRGFSVSWPIGKRIPAFVRLDHALVGEQLVVDDVDDIDVPGSDHRGFIVTVRPAA